MVSEHPTDQDLRSYRAGRLGAEVGGAIGEHVKNCPNCRQRVGSMTVQEAPAGQSPPPGRTTVERPEPAGAATVPVGLEVPDYEVIRRLGGGGMGVVYLARNTLMGRMEVLKVVAQHLTENTRVLDRFLREIQAAARLQHRNIVAAYAAIRAGDGLILAMEYVDGSDLEARVRARGPLPVAEACFYAYQAAQGLQHAHARGMVHRDIKPANLILGQGEGKGIVKVLDFGLAKVASEGPVDGGLTRQGLMLGTPDYMAPEQIRDARKADIRADIYSLGCTLYYLLSGGPPFDGESLYDILQAHHSNEAGPLDLLRPDVPVDLAALVAKMMAKEPDRRFPTPSAVAEALLPFFKPGAAQAANAPSPAPAVAKARRTTLVEGVEDAAPAVMRRSTLVEGPSSAGVRRATLVEGEGAVPPTRAAGATLVDLGEPASLRGDRPKAPVPEMASAVPAWKRPPALAAAGALAAAVFALGVGLATTRSREPSPGVAPAPAAVGPASEAIAVAVAKAPAPATKTDRVPPPPPTAPPAPVAQADPGPEVPPELAEAEAPEAAPAAEVVEARPAARPNNRRPSAGPGEVFEATYKDLAGSPGDYEGLRVVPPKFFLIATRVNLGDKHVPGYGRLIVATNSKQTLALDQGPFRDAFGIVLDKGIGEELQGFLARKKYEPSVEPTIRMVPTIEVRRIPVDGRERPVAVVVAMELMEAWSVQKILDNDIEAAYRIARFGDGKTRGVKSLAQDWYERLGGQAEKDRLRKRLLAFQKAHNAARRNAEADLQFQQFMNDGMRQIQRQDQRLKMEQNRTLDRMIRGR